MQCVETKEQEHKLSLKQSENNPYIFSCLWSALATLPRIYNEKSEEQQMNRLANWISEAAIS